MRMKKQTFFAIFGIMIINLACSFVAGIPATPTQVAEIATIVATTMQALTAAPSESVSTQVPTQISGTPVSFENVSLVIPNGLAGGANTEAAPAISAESGAPWEVVPAHLIFTLTEYQLQNKFHEPRIFVYPADEYAIVNSHAENQINQIKKILAGSPISKNTLPRIPWFNAEALISVNIQIIKFQNGSGIRDLTLYSQYLAPINNRELFYHFEGLTDDGKYYVLAILPITAPILPDDEKPDAVVPPGGVPIPTDFGPDNTIYYDYVTEKLNSLDSDSFSPSLSALDALMQSLLVTNP
jgi:hypothetical protein